MKKNDLILLFTVALYSYLFYDQSAGINFLIFSTILIGLQCLNNKDLLKNPAWIFASIGVLVTSISIVINNHLLSVIANLVSLSLIASFSVSKNSSLLIALLHSLYSYLSIIPFMFMKLMEKKTQEAESKNPMLTKVLIIGIPIIITSIFFFLYQEANPVFKNFTSNITIDFIIWDWMRFTLLGFVLVYAFFNHRKIQYLFTKDESATDDLIKENNHRSLIFGKSFAMDNENLSGIILFGLLNLLLLVVNILDIDFLWITQSVPEGINYSEFVHQSIELLIASIIVAILIILFYFRGSLNFYNKNVAIKILAYLWIIQNAILIITTASKNQLYINEYSLTYKRIGVAVYLLLSLIGLITTFIKIYKTKSNWFLFRKNGWAFYTVLIVSCFINWDLLIANFNITHSKNVDEAYLLSLSNSTLPQLWERQDSLQSNPMLINKLHTKTSRFINEWNNAGWQSWNNEDKRIYDSLMLMKSNGKIKALTINENNREDVTSTY